jgi:hypothetical protein
MRRDLCGDHSTFAGRRSSGSNGCAPSGYPDSAGTLGFHDLA